MKKKILYVDDELSNHNGTPSMYAKSINHVLGKSYELDFATTEAEGLSKIKDKKYDIIIVDGNLNYAGGHNLDSDYETGKHVAEAAKNSGAYVIGASSEPKRFERIVGDTLDISYHKPFDLQLLGEIFENRPTKSEFEEKQKTKKKKNYARYDGISGPNRYPNLHKKKKSPYLAARYGGEGRSPKPHGLR